MLYLGTCVTYGVFSCSYEGRGSGGLKPVGDGFAALLAVTRVSAWRLPRGISEHHPFLCTGTRTVPAPPPQPQAPAPPVRGVRRALWEFVAGCEALPSH